jgi:UDP-2,3-diacylglucosamine hydrolase
MQAFQVLEAPEHWRTIDFISDLHLQEKEFATFQAWQLFMQHSSADAVFIVGDLFEVWVGDDAVHSNAFLKQCGAVLKAATTHKHVAFMRGNRDFLVGSDFLQSCQVEDLSDPTLLMFGGLRWLLSHGDEGCLADLDYQVFRKTVRTPDWQSQFLARPLEERQDIARNLRLQSEALKTNGAKLYADVDPAWALAALTQARCSCLLHGHTHKPADHVLGSQADFVRRVLSDWDLSDAKPRAEVLRWHVGGKVERLSALNCAAGF